MPKRSKLWMSISTVTMAGIAGLSACSHVGEGESEGEGESAVEMKVGQAAGYEGEGEGESEGSSNSTSGEGEGEGASSGVDLATDDLAYLSQLNLMKGHLYVGYKLYKDGELEAAKTHMKHPESELYADVAPAFVKRGAKGFAEELTALAEAVEADKGVDAVGEAYDTLITSIDKSAAKVSVDNQSAAKRLSLAVSLLRVAAEEYGIAVVDGKLENAHEYQDALGFTTIASAIVDGIEGDSEALKAKNSAAAIVKDLMSHWPGLVPPEKLTTEAGKIYGAASRIELLSLGLQ